MKNADAVPDDMKRKLESFDEDAERLIAEFIRTIEATQTPPIIYHYTNDVGLIGSETVRSPSWRMIGTAIPARSRGAARSWRKC
jgi:hypothetical protein